MKNTTVFRSAAAALTAVSALMILSCGSSSKNEAYISFFTGTVTIQRSGAAVTPAIKAAIHNGDSVIVGPRSCLVVQTTEGLIVRVEENTEAVLSALGSADAKEVKLAKGKVLSLVGKLQKKNAYQVVTPTTVAAVRGTQFLTEYNGKTSVVAVGEGLVKVTSDRADKIAEKGMTVVSGQSGAPEIRSVNIVEGLELTKIAGTPVVDVIEGKSAEELKKIFEEPSMRDSETNETIREEVGCPIDELRKKYGRIDIVTLFSGKVIRGVIFSRGKTYRVLTPHGAIYISASDVSGTSAK